MRSWLAQYEMRGAASLDEALTLLATEPGAWVPFAGGTDLMVLLDAGRLEKKKYLNIWPLEELRGVAVTDRVVSIGALATYTDLLADPVLASEFPLVGAAARETGAIAIQNRGTIGGNIANASPAADLPPALLVYDATLEVASVRGRRTVPYDRFHLGYKQMDLAADELIVRITLPRDRAGWKQAYRKVGTRRAQAISKICFAAAADILDGKVQDIRVAYGSVAPTVVRATRAEAALRGRRLDESAIAAAAKAVRSDIAAIDDIRSTASYRQMVAVRLLEDFLS